MVVNILSGGDKLKIQLDSQLCKELKEKINEHHNFTYEKTANFKFPNNKKDVSAGAYKCICATLARINDLVEHCNNIETEGQFGLCDFLNYTQSLIECINIIGRVYKVEPLYKGVNKNDTSVFHQAGLNNNGNDEKYFTYLRSLCSVHPVETSRHAEYQGNQAEWCPYILTDKSSMLVQFPNVYPDLKDADFVVTIYRNDMKLCKYVPIYIKDLIAYVQKRYQHIRQIIKAINDCNQELIDNYKKKPIPEPGSFTDYISYFNNLQSAITERCGENHSDKTKKWICIMKAHFEDNTMQEKLFAYQEVLKTGIANIHQQLQQMEIDYYFEEEPISYDTSFVKNSYVLEKLDYLQEDFWRLSLDEAVKLAESGGETFNNNRIDNMLSMISDARMNGADDEGLLNITRYIDRQYTITNSEWARIQLKIIEPYFDNIVEFDYHLNDWYLHLQVEIAFWLLSQRS